MNNVPHLPQVVDGWFAGDEVAEETVQAPSWSRVSASQGDFCPPSGTAWTKTERMLLLHDNSPETNTLPLGPHPSLGEETPPSVLETPPARIHRSQVLAGVAPSENPQHEVVSRPAPAPTPTTPTSTAAPSGAGPLESNDWGIKRSTCSRDEMDGGNLTAGTGSLRNTLWARWHGATSSKRASSSGGTGTGMGWLHHAIATAPPPDRSEKIRQERVAKQLVDEMLGETSVHVHVVRSRTGRALSVTPPRSSRSITPQKVDSSPLISVEDFPAQATGGASTPLQENMGQELERNRQERLVPELKDTAWSPICFLYSLHVTRGGRGACLLMDPPVMQVSKRCCVQHSLCKTLRSHPLTCNTFSAIYTQSTSNQQSLCFIS